MEKSKKPSTRKTCKRAIRSTTLIANFPPHNTNTYTFAKGWFFSLSSAFRDALDIKYTPRKNSQAGYTWTQGESYSFKEGDTIYDSEEAYYTRDKGNPEEFTWAKAVEKLSLCIQVISSTAAVPSSYDEDSGEIINNDGQIKFQIFEYSNGQVKPIRSNVFHCTQPEFIKLLKHGLFKQLGNISNSKITNLYPNFKPYSLYTPAPTVKTERTQP